MAMKTSVLIFLALLVVSLINHSQGASFSKFYAKTAGNQMSNSGGTLNTYTSKNSNGCSQFECAFRCLSHSCTTFNQQKADPCTCEVITGGVPASSANAGYDSWQ